MLKSMTAYARAEHVADWGSLQWELRSVNNRYFDISLRLPDELRRIEGAVRERTRAKVSRGKVDVTCKLGSNQNADAGDSLDIDTGRARQVVAAAQAIRALAPGDAMAPIAPLDVLRWPGIVRLPQLDMDAVADAALTSLRAALEDLVATRGREGTKLNELIAERCDQMGALTRSIAARLPQVVTDTRTRLRARLDELRGSVDEARLEQEIVMFAQRMDCAEELDRLDAHVSETLRVLGANGPSGRRLDFLAQEMNREANTIASKSSDADVTRDAVALKVLVEQIREQVQNIE